MNAEIQDSEESGQRMCFAMKELRVFLFLLIVLTQSPSVIAATLPDKTPSPPGKLVDIGGQRLHLNCVGKGSPTVILESGTGDVSVIWSLVQPRVAAFTRVCSYDRGGYAWSLPGSTPRTFAQLALELHAALDRLKEKRPYILVGQSYGGFVVRGFAHQYRSEVQGMVLVDAVHEDQQIVYGGQPHRIRDSARGRQFPEPRIALDTKMANLAAKETPFSPEERLEAPLDRLPSDAQLVWRWANTLPLLRMVQEAELDWSPEELARMHNERLVNRASLGDLPLIVLARTNGGYPDGMSISAAELENERRQLQEDLARLSRRGRLIFAAHSGHNIHLEEPNLVVGSIQQIVNDYRRHR